MLTIDKIKKDPPSVLVFGDIMLDEFIVGSVNRISPEAPVPVVVGERNLTNLGGCGNVIQNLFNIGVGINLVSAIGDDSTGDIIKRKIDEMRPVYNGLLVLKETRSTRKMRVIAERQHIVRVDWDSNGLSSIDSEKILSVIPKAIESSDGIIISDYDKGFCNNEITSFLIKEAKKNQVDVFVDPKGVDWNKYSGATLITPNLKEAEMIIGSSISNDEEVELAGNKICDLYKIKTCIITRGPEGISVISNSQCTHIPSNAREVFDVSGAGDTVIACLTSALLSGIDLIQAVTFANYAAGMVVGHVGTVPVRMHELKSINF